MSETCSSLDILFVSSQLVSSQTHSVSVSICLPWRSSIRKRDFHMPYWEVTFSHHFVTLKLFPAVDNSLSFKARKWLTSEPINAGTNKTMWSLNAIHGLRLGLKSEWKRFYDSVNIKCPYLLLCFSPPSVWEEHNCLVWSCLVNSYRGFENRGSKMSILERRVDWNVMFTNVFLDDFSSHKWLQAIGTLSVNIIIFRYLLAK